MLGLGSGLALGRAQRRRAVGARRRDRARAGRGPGRTRQTRHAARGRRQRKHGGGLRRRGHAGMLHGRGGVRGAMRGRGDRGARSKGARAARRGVRHARWRVRWRNGERRRPQRLRQMAKTKTKAVAFSSGESGSDRPWTGGKLFHRLGTTGCHRLQSRRRGQSSVPRLPRVDRLAGLSPRRPVRSSARASWRRARRWRSRPPRSPRARAWGSARASADARTPHPAPPRWRLPASFCLAARAGGDARRLGRRAPLPVEAPREGGAPVGPRERPRERVVQERG